MTQSFRPAHRIRRRAEFQRVYERGRRAHGRLMTLVLLPNDSDSCRLGVSATRKLGNAVKRNLAKRLLREVFRRRHPSVPTDVVVIPRPPIFEASYRDVEAEYRLLLERRPAPTRSAGGRPAAGG